MKEAMDQLDCYETYVNVNGDVASDDRELPPSANLTSI
jgi:hypothetical protein